MGDHVGGLKTVEMLQDIVHKTEPTRCSAQDRTYKM
jgi:hypothetical protein